MQNIELAREKARWPQKMSRAYWDAAQLLDVVNHTSEAKLHELRRFASSKNYLEVACRLNKEDAGKLVDALDQAIESVDLREPRNMMLLRTLGSICSARVQLPHTMILSDGVERCGDIAVASGGFTDTWQGLYRTKKVALKAFRTYPVQDQKEVEKTLWKEVVVWKRLSHEHVLPFYGVDDANFQLALVYDWADSGNIIQYLCSNSEVSRTHLLREAAEGLFYLHSQEIVHGDLKGTNVLISNSGHACLSDYGLMPIKSNHVFRIAATPGVADISRWLAPELIRPSQSRQPVGTKQADIFAFAMLDIEVFTGKLPFGNSITHRRAVLLISKGDRPEKPGGIESRGFSTEVWLFIQRCWRQNPTERPSIDAVVAAWRGFDAERSREPTPAADTIDREKRQLCPREHFTEPTGRTTKKWFCGLI